MEREALSWREGTAHPTAIAAEERRMAITARSVLPQTGLIQSQQATSQEARAMRFLAKSHRAKRIVPPRNGISPVAVAGWAVLEIIAGNGRITNPITMHVGFTPSGER
jgi:hypothetical protein